MKDRGVALQALAHEIEACRRCPRLVEWRERVARERRAAYAHERYAAHPVAGFGDPAARVLILGLAPAAHGGNRTGRIFTGDRSGDFLFAALWRAGLANQPTSTDRDDGLRLHGAWVTAAVRCAPPANRPTSAERDTCLPWSAAELRLLGDVRVVLCLGAFAWDAALRLEAMLRAEAARAEALRAEAAPVAETALRAEALRVKAAPVADRARRPPFAHGAEHHGERFTMIGCYHPSQQNTFTGRLTESMLDEILRRVRALVPAA